MSRVRAWLAVWSGWTALALFFAASTSLTYRSTGRPANWTLTLQRSLSEWWLWALLTPLVVSLARRFPLHGDHRVRNVALHVAAGMVIAVGKTVADRAIFALVSGFWTYLLFTTLALQFALYAAVVAAAHGVQYYRRSREREQLEAQLAETRLQMLNMQLQPHFLFNTLNTIAEMVHEDPDKADTMIAGLSDLLRRTLDLGAVQEITVAEEIDLVERYLQIQQARFGDRLRIQMTVSDAARRARVPALLLQPIVENAIRHGLAARLDAGRIDIDARIDAGMLVLTVTDDGSGDPAEVITGPERVGLGNTRARLSALYGGAARLSLRRAEGRGARVTIEIGLREGELVRRSLGEDGLVHRSLGEGGR
jgi:two-component system LytT family sensor kinase